jgi:hypothetical protein
MTVDDMNVRDLAGGGLLAGALGVLGRLLAMAQGPRPALGWSLLWELPAAIGLGIIGKGLADWLHLDGFPEYAVTIAVSYTGPRAIDMLIESWRARK